MYKRQGSDSINPFLEAAKGEDKCVFVLVKTSNPGSGELQDVVAGDRLVYQVMGDLNERIAKGTAVSYTHLIPVFRLSPTVISTSATAKP